MVQNSFEQKITADYVLNRQGKSKRLTTRVIGLLLIAVGLGYFGHWYFNSGGKLLLFPKSAPVYTISEIDKRGSCRFEASIERKFSLLAIAFEREAYLAEDVTGKIEVDFPHKVEFPEKDVWIVGKVDSQGVTVRAVWIDNRFSWHVALDVIVPLVLTLLGACLLYLSFCPDKDKKGQA